MIFKKFFDELIASVGMEIEMNFLRGLEVPDSDRGMEIVIFW
jgi:hypothetical protein